MMQHQAATPQVSLQLDVDARPGFGVQPGKFQAGSRASFDRQIGGVSSQRFLKGSKRPEASRRAT